MAARTLTATAHYVYVAGDTVRLRVTVTMQDGSPASLVGMTARFALTDRASGAEVASTEATPPTASATIVDATNGLVDLVVPASVTATLAGDVYRWRCWLTDLAGEVVTPIQGSFHFTKPS